MGSSLFRQAKDAERCLKPNPEEEDTPAEVGYGAGRASPCRNDKRAERRGRAMLDRVMLDFTVCIFLYVFALYLFLVRFFSLGVLFLLLLIYIILTRGGRRDGWGGAF
ncbi:MAG: hypothetical protein QXN24_03220 [Candidatus Bathyarchaeia archaeon]